MDNKKNYEQHYMKQIERIMETTAELALEKGIDGINITKVGGQAVLGRQTK